MALRAVQRLLAVGFNNDTGVERQLDYWLGDPCCTLQPRGIHMPLNEADTRAKLIDPALHRRGWTEWDAP